MKKTYLIILAIFLFLGLFIFGYGLVNTAVSIEYETENGECISNVDGTNLCLVKTVMLVLAVSCFLSLIYLLNFINKLKKK